MPTWRAVYITIVMPSNDFNTKNAPYTYWDSMRRKTVLSVSVDSEVYRWLTEEGAPRSKNVSRYINSVLRERMYQELGLSPEEVMREELMRVLDRTPRLMRGHLRERLERLDVWIETRKAVKELLHRYPDLRGACKWELFEVSKGMYDMGAGRLIPMVSWDVAIDTMICSDEYKRADRMLHELAKLSGISSELYLAPHAVAVELGYTTPCILEEIREERGAMRKRVSAPTR